MSFGVNTLILFEGGALFSKGDSFWGGPYFQRWQRGSSYSEALKLILMMYMG